MFDGVERILGGVTYVPKLQKNIISISQLDSKGCRVLVEGGAMKITLGNMVVARGEEKVVCTASFRLQGNTVHMISSA